MDIQRLIPWPLLKQARRAGHGERGAEESNACYTFTLQGIPHKSFVSAAQSLRERQGIGAEGALRHSSLSGRCMCGCHFRASERCPCPQIQRTGSYMHKRRPTRLLPRSPHPVAALHAVLTCRRSAEAGREGCNKIFRCQNISPYFFLTFPPETGTAGRKG